MAHSHSKHPLGGQAENLARTNGYFASWRRKIDSVDQWFNHHPHFNTALLMILLIAMGVMFVHHAIEFPPMVP